MKRLVGFIVCLLAVVAVLGAGAAPALVAAHGTAPRLAAAGEPAAATGAAPGQAGTLEGSTAHRDPAVLAPLAVPVSRPAPLDDGDMDTASGLTMIGANLVALALVLLFVRRRAV